MATPTHVVTRRFGGPGGEQLQPGQLVRCEGEDWKNARSLENARYLRQVTPADLAAADEKSGSKSRRGKEA